MPWLSAAARRIGTVPDRSSAAGAGTEVSESPLNTPMAQTTTTIPTTTDQITVWVRLSFPAECCAGFPLIR